MIRVLQDVVDQAEQWTRSDREELLAHARKIDARRRKVYVLSAEERAAVQKGRKSPLVSEKKVKAFWKRLGVA
ncbi:hypothetical protein A2851_03625 [Candidatus Kaiserbacteria bacterium RIFCSPHIGHO2_01_FULL_53_29]|uniref:Uncharacterized protein n=1 Tax=Candidatus Kaiserbacteria bacterium RIFCSPHIGHO2_01_FULL_53_29 TaxID=1798480 RepID=A0A1F6CVT5_9BACT|nr:MAG: hypothetical protein A2851_03625 [Candidatus Kaiserbacteria bacterium RIFCSPHIGHO2_01_FULL_53_29]